MTTKYGWVLSDREYECGEIWIKDEDEFPPSEFILEEDVGDPDMSFVCRTKLMDDGTYCVLWSCEYIPFVDSMCKYLLLNIAKKINAPSSIVFLIKDAGKSMRDLGLTFEDVVASLKYSCKTGMQDRDRVENVLMPALSNYIEKSYLVTLELLSSAEALLMSGIDSPSAKKIFNSYSKVISKAMMDRGERIMKYEKSRKQDLESDLWSDPVPIQREFDFHEQDQGECVGVPCFSY
jgi:hypothetical protein